MLYFSGSGVQIFSLGMIFMLLTGPISAVLNIFNGVSPLSADALGPAESSELTIAFEALRPTPPPVAVKKNKDAVVQPSYLPLVVPMIVYVACQGLV